MRATKSSKTSKTSQDDITTPRVPRGLRGLPNDTPSPSLELKQLNQDATVIQEWWKQPRWRYTKRIYSGECLVQEDVNRFG